MTAWTIARALPGMLIDDDLASRLVEAFDDAYEPFIRVLDCYPAYLDPRLAPEDHLAALAAWLGADPSEGGVGPTRTEIAAAVEAHGERGTFAGLVRRLERLTGSSPEVNEAGGVTWSSTPGSPLPAVGDRTVRVRLNGAFEAAAQERLEAEVRAAVPAHLPVALEVDSS
jgi:phage tail-like protein